MQRQKGKKKRRLITVCREGKMWKICTKRSTGCLARPFRRSLQPGNRAASLRALRESQLNQSAGGSYSPAKSEDTWPMESISTMQCFIMNTTENNLFMNRSETIQDTRLQIVERQTNSQLSNKMHKVVTKGLADWRDERKMTLFLGRTKNDPVPGSNEK